MSINEYAIIVAGGKGTRMRSTTPKQFMPVDGLPVLIHTIRAFLNYSSAINIILVLPSSDISTWSSICEQFHFASPAKIVEGGKSRFQSVRNGLNSIEDSEGLVAIHDGVRPLISKDIIGASFRLAAVHKSAVASVRLKESLRLTDQHTTKAVDRSAYRLIQTPQTFDLSLIKRAYQTEEDPSLTDDASVAERFGLKISLFEGSYRNIKITTPEDIAIAETLLKES